jgi:hypothetical protein
MVDIVNCTPAELQKLWDDLDQQISPMTSIRRHRRKPELKVQRAIIGWLAAQGIVLAVTDAGMLNKMGLAASCGIPAGWPDITGCLPGGRFLGVECKSAKGRQSPEQARCQARIESNGGLYIVAHSLAELQQAFALENILENSSD